MTFHRPALTLALALALGGAALTACTTLPTVPAAGTTVDAKFMQDYMPAYKKGMKWTYAQTSVSGGNTVKSESTTEVMDVQGDVVSVQLTSKLDGSSDATTSTATMSTAPKATMTLAGTEVALKSEGSVDVTVPYKEFKGIAKLSMVNGAMTYYAWYAPGIGMVKSEMTNASGEFTATSTMELTAFVSP